MAEQSESYPLVGSAKYSVAARDTILIDSSFSMVEACTAYFGVGRPALHAFTSRQYATGFGKQAFALNKELRTSIDFFIALLQKLPPHREPLQPDANRPIYIWSDAMWESLRADSGDLVSVVDPDTGDVFYLEMQ